MEEIIVTSQEQLDAIQTDYNGRIIIKFGTPYNRAVVTRKFKYSVVARENSFVVARGNSSVVAWENSSVVAWGNSSVEAWENSSVVARENSFVVARGNNSVEAWENSSVVAWGNSSVVAWRNNSVEAWENSSVEAWENSSVVARENSFVVARGNSSVVAWGNSSVVAWGNSSVVAWGNSSVEAWGNSSVEAWENSSVVAWENSSVEAWENSSVEAWENSSVVARENSFVHGAGNVQIVDSTYSHKVKASGNARIVYNPKTPQEYVGFYGLESDGRSVKLYKAVHNRNGVYESDNDYRFKYVIGEEAVVDRLDTDSSKDCGHGIHAAHMAWCVDYGRGWKDLAILEVEMELDGMIVPVNGSGKVRAAKCRVLREVPLSECGLYGKILSKAK